MLICVDQYPILSSISGKHSGWKRYNQVVVYSGSVTLFCVNARNMFALTLHRVYDEAIPLPATMYIKEVTMHAVPTSYTKL